MRRLKAQYAVAYAVEGALLPFLPLYLSHVQGLDARQIGAVLAAGSVAVLVTPLLISALADTRVNQRRLLAGAFGVAGGLFALLELSPAYPVTFALFAAFSLAHEPVKPLQDAHFFAVKHHHGWSTSFSSVRVWGTLGYIAPGAAAYWLLDDDAAVSVIVPLTLLLCLAAAANALRLPDAGRQAGAPLAVEAAGAASGDAPHPPGTVSGVLAVIRAAATRIRRPPVLLFVVGMFFLQMAAAGYMAFYPLYLTESVGIASRWVGLISGVGVVIEIGYMLGFPWMLRRMGWRRFMILGCAAQVARLVLLGIWPTVAVAVGTQVVHGLIVVASLVGARVLLDRMAGEGHRYAMHGLYTMTVVGGGRIVGNLGAGALAASSLALVFLAGAVLSAVAVALVVLAFRHSALASLETSVA